MLSGAHNEPSSTGGSSRSESTSTGSARRAASSHDHAISLFTKTVVPRSAEKLRRLAFAPNVLDRVPVAPCAVALPFARAGVLIGLDSVDQEKSRGRSTGVVALRFAEALIASAHKQVEGERSSPAVCTGQAAVLYAAFCSYLAKRGSNGVVAEVLGHTIRSLRDPALSPEPKVFLKAWEHSLRQLANVNRGSLPKLESCEQFLDEASAVFSREYHLARVSYSFVSGALSALVTAHARVGSPQKGLQILNDHDALLHRKEVCDCAGVLAPIPVRLRVELRNGAVESDTEEDFVSHLDSLVAEELLGISPLQRGKLLNALALGSLRSGRFNESSGFANRAVGEIAGSLAGRVSSSIDRAPFLDSFGTLCGAQLADSQGGSAIHDIQDRMESELRSSSELVQVACMGTQRAFELVGNNDGVLSRSAQLLEHIVDRSRVLPIQDESLLLRMESWSHLVGRSDFALKLRALRCSKDSEVSKPDVCCSHAKHSSSRDQVLHAWFRALADGLSGEETPERVRQQFYRGSQILVDAARQEVISQKSAIHLSRVGSLLSSAAGSLEVMVAMQGLPPVLRSGTSEDHHKGPTEGVATKIGSDLKNVVLDLVHEANAAVVAYHSTRFLAGVRVEAIPEALFLSSMPESRRVAYR